MSAIVNTLPTTAPRANALLLLFGRTGLFLGLQSLLAAIFWLLGTSAAWEASIAWWPYTVTAVNLLCLAALVRLYAAEGKRYWSIFRIKRATIGRDLLIMLGVLILIGPLGYFPNVWMAAWLFDDPETALALFLRPLPLWGAIGAVLLFPVIHGLAELPLYFAYVMPRLDARPFPNLMPILLPGFMLAFQHIAIPFVPDLDFLLWRGLMFLPFALAVGVVLHWRPRLLPYLVIIHILMDLSLPLMLLAQAY